MRDRLARLSAFLRVAERGSLTGAASDLGVSQPTVTRALSALEAELGATLFHRTTHSVALTEAGRTLMPRARRLVAGWDGLVEDMAQADALAGPLHVVAPVALGQTALIPILAAFREAHPAVTFAWTLTDAPIRMSEIGADLWLRVGPVPDDRLVVRPLGRVARSVLGRPAFVDRPLEDCPWIALDPYEGRRIALPDRMIEVDPVLRTRSIMAVAAALRAGIGVGIAPDWLVRGDADGLVRLAPAEPLPVHLAFPPESRSRRLEAFAEAVAEGLAPLFVTAPASS